MRIGYCRCMQLRGNAFGCVWAQREMIFLDLGFLEYGPLQVVLMELRAVDKTMALVKEMYILHKSIAEAAENAVERRSPVRVTMADVKKRGKQFKRTEADVRRVIEWCGSYVHSAVTKSREMIKEFIRKGKNQISKTVVFAGPKPVH